MLIFSSSRLRHRQTETIAFGRRHQRQADAGVASGGFEDHLVLRQFASPFGLLDHMGGHAVLDGTAGVEIFELGKDPHLAAGIQPADLHKRRIADGLVDAVIGLDHDAEGNTSVSL